MQRLTDREYLLYSRTMLLNDIGEAGQLAILNSRVVIIGMGGLGQLVAQYLAASGVKHLILVDHDNVELSLCLSWFDEVVGLEHFTLVSTHLFDEARVVATVLWSV